MLVKINTKDGRYILEVDTLNEEILRKTIDKIKREWVKQFLKVDKKEDGSERYTLLFPNGDTRHRFDCSDNEEYCLTVSVDNTSLYEMMPTDLIVEKFKEAGFCCRLHKSSGNEYYV